MIRLAFMRLINRLEFDCAMYDIDAVILKNPQPLYDKHKSDIVGSRGELPRQLMRKYNRSPSALGWSSFEATQEQVGIHVEAM